MERFYHLWNYTATSLDTGALSGVIKANIIC